MDELYTRCLGLRWLLFDELSTLSPQLLGTLDSYLRRACSRHPHARSEGHRRCFGGLNLVLCGDFWQLPPVKSNALFSNPYKSGYSSAEQRIFGMFWKKEKDSIQQTFVLDKSMRSQDPWLLQLLHADRYGAASWEMSVGVGGCSSNGVCLVFKGYFPVE